MNELRERLGRAWAQRQPRERRFLIALAAFVGCALLIQGVWSARSASARLRKQIPQLSLQVGLMQRQASEIRQLQAQSKSTSAALLEGNALLAAANTAAKVGNLSLAASELQLEGPRQLRLRATVPFDRWMEWTATVQLELRLRLVHCQIEGTGSAGMVKVDALMALPEPA
jgi:type II secretory pathway component PulM